MKEAIPHSPLGQTALRNASARFVGRAEELAQLRNALDTSSGGPRVLVIEGPAGVGKTTLASLTSLHAMNEGLTSTWLPCEQIQPHLPGVLEGFAHLGRPRGLAEFGHGDEAELLTLDGFEHIGGLAAWLLTHELMKAGDNLVLVLTTRQPLEPSVAHHLALEPLVRRLPLEPFDEAHCEEMLRLHGATELAADACLEATGGSPLALAILASRSDLWAEFTRRKQVPHEVLAAMRPQLLRSVPGTGRRVLLYALSLTLSADDGLLRSMLPDHATPDALTWLHSLPYVQKTPWGLALHELMRESLHQELVERDSALWEQLSARACRELALRMSDLDFDEQRELVIRGLFIRRNHAILRETRSLDTLRSTFIDQGTGDDEEMTAGAIALGESADAARAFKSMHAEQPEGLFVQRQTASRPIGAYYYYTLEAGARADHADPVLQRVMELAREIGATVGVFRWFFAFDGYHELGTDLGAMMLGGPQITSSLETPPRFTFVVTTEPDRWAPLAPRTFVERVDGADVHWSGVHYGIWRMDAHRIGPSGSVSERLRSALPGMLMGIGGVLPAAGPYPPPTADGSSPTDDRAQRAPKLAAAAVRRAYKDLHRPHRLAKSPLVDVVARDAASPSLALSDWLRSEVERLRGVRNLEVYAEVLHETYVEPHVKQHAAAMALGLPWGTYQHRLRRAIELVTEEAQRIGHSRSTGRAP